MFCSHNNTSYCINSRKTTSKMAGGPEDSRSRMNRNVPDIIEDCQQMKLTEEELRVLRECRTNSLYLRGLPLGMLSAIATRYLGHNFFPHIRNWAGFYYTGAFTMGVVLGVASYKDKCFERIMSLENSVLADQVRKYQKELSPETIAGSEVKNKPRFGPRPPMFQQGKTDEQQMQSHVSDEQEDFDSAENRGSKITSYEELRRRNRDRQYQGPRRMPPTPTQQTNEDNSMTSQDTYESNTSYDKRETYSPGTSWESDAPKTNYDDTAPNASSQWTQGSTKDHLRRNKYGDEME